MVLYRKYRPQKLEELDSQEIRTRLSSILSSKSTPHAFLFAGPKGTGKTSAARIVAKILNCEKIVKKQSSNRAIEQSSIEPCNSCESCISITEGRHLDVLEIDAASNRGIDEIRELREKIKLAPVSARFKVYIIDEVHMLTNEAFNALLKTLEEPPSHAVFILATTAGEKLPETIVSRCLRFNFNKATIEEVLRSLRRVVDGEKVTLSDEAFTLLASFAEGSFRDATKLLEQAIAEKATTAEEISRLLGRDHLNVGKFLKILAEKKTKELLATFETMAERGVDFRFFVTEVLNFLHDLLLAQYGIGKEKIPKEALKIFNASEINRLIQLFSKVYGELKVASRPELPLEVAVVEWCEMGTKN